MIFDRYFAASALVAALMLTGCGKGTEPTSSQSPVVQTTATATSSEGSVSGQQNLGQTLSREAASEDSKPPAFEAAPRELQVDRKKAQETVAKADKASRAGRYHEAAAAYSEALVNDPQNPEIPYKGARNYAAWGKSDLAIESLGVAADLGYSDAGTVRSQTEFEPLRPNPRFSKIVKRIEANR